MIIGKKSDDVINLNSLIRLQMLHNISFSEFSVVNFVQI